MVKVKQLNVTANYTWSPSELYPIQIVTATAAQQLDASFSTNSNLSLHTVDLSNPSQELTPAGQIVIPNRFYKVIWGHGGLESKEDDRGLVICGADNGLINIYDPAKLTESSDNSALVTSNNKHTGPVKALDFNPFQKNLYASGANDSEIFIWDLKNPGNPMTPGKKTEPLVPISCVAWNRQVQHILGSSTSVTSGPSCYVWDLRKNASIIKVQDSSGRMQCSEIAWHPEVATQLVLASEDDRSPVVQLWDLRFANSPLRVLENHHRGVLSVAWCQHDPDLLLTCGKDNRVICWNPNATPPEILYEVPNTPQWCFDVQWCPRNPAMISLGSFDGNIGIHSLMGGSSVDVEMPNKQQQNALAESFGDDAFAAAPVRPTPVQKKVVAMPLKKPPKWISKPCGASFSFGGKLVSFENPKPTAQQGDVAQKKVTIHQVVTETGFITRSEELQDALSSNRFAGYCQKKMESAESVFEEDIWSFMKARFDPNPRKEFLHLLGYDAAKIKSKVSSLVGPGEEEKLTTKMEGLSASVASSESSQSGDGSDAFEVIAASQSAVSLSSGDSTPKKQQLIIPSGDGDPESLISQALLVGDYESAVNLCLREDRMADAIVLAIAGGPQLLERTRRQYFTRSSSKIGRLMLAVATKNWADIVTSCELSNWKEALATLLTYSNKEEMNTLCDELGTRLEADPSRKIHACLCYVCSGNIEKLVHCWDSMKSENKASKSTPESLQDLIEKVMILLRAVESVSQQSLGQAASEKLANYSSILASQGKLDAAMQYLPESSDKTTIMLLKDRLSFALGLQQQQVQQQVSPMHQRMRQTRQPNPAYNATTYQQPSKMNVANSRAVPMQPERQPSPARTDSPSSNPYKANRRAPTRPNYAAPSNLYTPQQTMTPAVTPVSVNGYNTATFQPQAPSMLPPGPMPAVPTSQPMQPNVTYGAPPRQPVSIPTDSPIQNPGGWNDPPALDPSRVPKKKKASVPSYQPQDYNFMTPTQPAAAPTPMMPNPAMNMNPQYALPQNPPGAPAGHPDQSLANWPAEVTEESDIADEVRAPAPSVPTKAAKDMPKAPIPSEHQILQTQFEGLIKHCLVNASNPQTKRKLDDCERRMEFLYDKLRANTLSPHIVSGLHQLAQSIGMKDYASGLRQHTHIVSSSNFSEISAFMPGLKSMLQIAAQLKV